MINNRQLWPIMNNAWSFVSLSFFKTSSAAAVLFVWRYRNTIIDDHARALPLGSSDRVKIISSHELIDILMVSDSSDQETQRHFV